MRDAVHVTQQPGDATHHTPCFLWQQHAFHGQGSQAVGGPLHLRAFLAGLEALLHVVAESLSLRHHGSSPELSCHTRPLQHMLKQHSFVKTGLVCYPGCTSQD